MAAIEPVWDDPRVVEGMRAQVARRAADLAGGEEHAGWKIGFGAPAAKANLGTSAALVGYLVKSRRVDDGGTVDISGFAKAALEPEVAVHLSGDVAPGATREETAAAIAGIGPAIEIADIHLPLDDVAAVLAGDIFQRAYVLGPITRAIGEVDLSASAGRVEADGEVLASTDDLTALVGDAVDLVRHAAGYLGASGLALEAGSVLITGSVTPLVFPTPGRTYRVDLGPVGSVSIRLV